jgi:hypothetical protein
MGHALGNNYGKFYSFQSKPVILDLQFQVNSAVGAGVQNVKGQGVQAVYMHTSTTPVTGSPNPATGICLIHLAYSYTRIYAGPWNIVSPLTGSDLAINATALTAHQPYQITAVGAGPTGVATVAPVADTAGSLAGTWFKLFDAYGNTFIVWFQVSGVGTAPIGVSGQLVQVSIASGATAAQVGTALATVLNNLSSNFVAGVNSFSASGTTTVTLTSTNTGVPLPGAPQDGSVPTGFTFALTKYGTNQNAWQQVGLPSGVPAAVGASFVATSTGYATGGGSTGTVKAISVSGITAMEIIGDSNLSLFPQSYGGSPNVGGWILLQFLAPTVSTGAYVSPMVPTAPADLSIVKMNFLLEQAARVGGNNE